MTAALLTDDEKHTLQHLMHNIDFVENYDYSRFRCQCCLQISLLHHIAECKHIFCDKCLYKIVNRSCPVKSCDNENIETLTQDKELEMEVCNLKMYCQFKEYGCKETFALQDYFSHQKKCQYITEGLLSGQWLKVKKSLPKRSMTEKMVSLDATVRDINTSLQTLEENVRIIQEKEKKYQAAFVILKEIEAIVKGQEKGNVQTESKQQLSENQDLESLSPESYLEMVLENTTENGQLETIKEEDNISNLKTTLHQLEEKLATFEKDLDLIRSNGAGLDDVNKLKTEFASLLADQMALIRDEVAKLPNSHIEKLNEEEQINVERINQTTENELEKLKEIKEKLEIHDEDIAMVKDIVSELQKQASEGKTCLDLVQEHAKKFKLEMIIMEEKLSKDMEDLIALEIGKHLAAQSNSTVLQEHLDGNQLETIPETVDCQPLTDNTEELKIRIEELESANEKLTQELTQMKKVAKEQINTFTETKKEIKEYYADINYQINSAKMASGTEFNWELKGFKIILENFQNNVCQEIESDDFLIKELGYKMRAKLMLYKDYLSIYLAFVGEENNSNQVYFHKRTFIVLDQNESRKEKQDLVRSWEPSFGHKSTEKWMKEFWGSLHFVPISLLENGDSYVRNDKIIIKIIIEPLSMLYKSFVSNDGVLYWRVENYHKQKEREIKGFSQGLKSDYFYTSQKGYRMQMELCLNGYGEENRGKYLSAFIWFRRGEWDDFLTKDFPHETTIWILDQSDSKEKIHLKKSIQLNSIKNMIYSKLALQSKIENSSYLKNGSLLMKIIVEPCALQVCTNK